MKPMDDARRISEAHGWLMRAANDLLYAENPLDTTGRSSCGYACFFAQQAAEKALKSVLMLSGLGIPKTHELMDIRKRIPKGDVWDALTNDKAALKALTEWAVSARYGDEHTVYPYATDQDAQEALLLAQTIFHCVREGMEAKGHPMPPEQLPQQLQSPPTIAAPSGDDVSVWDRP